MLTIYALHGVSLFDAQTWGICRASEHTHQCNTEEIPCWDSVESALKNTDLKHRFECLSPGDVNLAHRLLWSPETITKDKLKSLSSQRLSASLARFITKHPHSIFMAEDKTI